MCLIVMYASPASARVSDMFLHFKIFANTMACPEHVPPYLLGLARNAPGTPRYARDIFMSWYPRHARCIPHPTQRVWWAMPQAYHVYTTDLISYNTECPAYTDTVLPMPHQILLFDLSPAATLSSLYHSYLMYLVTFGELVSVFQSEFWWVLDTLARSEFHLQSPGHCKFCKTSIPSLSVYISLSQLLVEGCRRGNVL